MSDELVKVEYSGSVGGKVFDTTSAVEAKKDGVFNEKAAYGPVLIPVGKGMVIKGLDEALEGVKQGDAKQVSIPAEKAFGPRQPELVKLVPISEFRNQGIDPFPGMPVELDGNRARVQSVSGGRVRVDFNHELAGLAVEYSFKVLDVYSTPQEKLDAIAGDLFQKKAPFKDGFCTISLSLKTSQAADVVMKKFRFLELSYAIVPELQKVEFKEEYEKG